MLCASFIGFQVFNNGMQTSCRQPTLQVDNWVYDEANSTFIEDDAMAARLMAANPNSFRKLVRAR